MGVLKVNVGDAVTPDWRNIGCGGGGIPGYVAGSTGSGTGTTISITLPAGIQAGDLLVIAVGTDARFSIGGPTGWTNHGGSPSGFGADVGIYSKTADGSESSTTVSWTSGFSRIYVTQARVFRGPTGVSDVGGAASSSPGLSYAAPEMTYTPGGDFDYVYFFLARDPTNAAPPSVTLPVDTEDVLSNSNSRVTMGSGSTPETNTSGTAGDHTATSNISSDWAVVRFGVERAASTPGRLKLWTGTEWVREVCDDDAVTDDFNRTDSGTLGSSGSLTWQQTQGVGEAGWGIVSNEASLTLDTTSHFAFGYVDAGTSDPTMQLTIGAINVAPIIRASPSLASYVLVGTDGLYEVSGPDAQTPTTYVQHAYSPSFTAGDVVGVTCFGSSITVSRNGVPLATHTVTFNQAETIVGFVNNGNPSQTLTVDDFVLGVPSHPLKVNVGTPDTPVWETVCCMTPI